MEAGLDNANATNNPFANSNGTEILQQKDGFLLNLTEGFKQNGAELSPSNEYVFDRPANGKRLAEEFDEDEDMGPETDVDAIDDSLLSPMTEPSNIDNKNIGGFDPFTADIEDKATLEMDLDIQKQQTSEFEPPRTPREETPTPPADEVHDAGVEENVGDSGEDSEDEWNYYKGDSAESEKVSSSKADQEVAELTKTVEEDDEDAAMSQLNPNAAEFVPISSPTRSVASPACRALVNDEVIAQSPRRATPSDIDINLPSPQDFEKEVKNRPSDVYSNGQDADNEQKLSSQEVMENLLNGRNIEDIEFHPGTPRKGGNVDEFHFGPNATPFSTPGKFLDQSEAALSTKAVFGDESSYLECKTLGLESSFITEDSNNANAFTAGEDVSDFQPLLSKPADPMSMSFYQDENETNPFDLNKVQILPDDDELLVKAGNNGQIIETSSNLLEHDPVAAGEPVVADLVRHTESTDSSLLCGISQLPKTPEPVLPLETPTDPAVCDFSPAKWNLIEASNAPLPITPEPNSEEQDSSSAAKTPDASSPLPQDNVLLDVDDRSSPISPETPRSPALRVEESVQSNIIIGFDVNMLEEKITQSVLSPEPTEEFDELTKSPQIADDGVSQEMLSALGGCNPKSPEVLTPEPTEELLYQTKSPEPTELCKSPVITLEPDTVCNTIGKDGNTEELICQKPIEEKVEEFFPICQRPNEEKDKIEEFFPICQKPTAQKDNTEQFTKKEVDEEEEFFPICSKPSTELPVMEEQTIISPEPVPDDIQEFELIKSPVPIVDDIKFQSSAPLLDGMTDILFKSPFSLNNLEVESKSPIPEYHAKSPLPTMDDFEVVSKSPEPLADTVKTYAITPEPIIDTSADYKAKSPEPTVEPALECLEKPHDLIFDNVQELESKSPESPQDTPMLNEPLDVIVVCERKLYEECSFAKPLEPVAEAFAGETEVSELLRASLKPDFLNENNLEVDEDLPEKAATTPEPAAIKELLETSEQLLADEIQNILETAESVAQIDSETKSPETIEESLDSEKRDLESPMEDITSSVKDDNSLTPEIIEEAKDISTEKETVKDSFVPISEPQLQAINTNYAQELNNAIYETETIIEKETSGEISSTPNTTLSEPADTESVNTAEINSILEKSIIPDVTSPLSPSEKSLELAFDAHFSDSHNLPTEDIIITNLIIPQYPEETVITPSEESKPEIPTLIDEKEAPAALPEVALEAETKENVDDTVVGAIGAIAVAATATAAVAAMKEKKPGKPPTKLAPPLAKKTSKLSQSPSKTLTAKPPTSAKSTIPSPTKPIPSKITKTTTLRATSALKTAPKPLAKPKSETTAAKPIEKKPLTNGDLKVPIKSPIGPKKPSTTVTRTSLTQKAPIAAKPSPTRIEAKSSLTKVSSTRVTLASTSMKSTTTTATTRLITAAPKPRPTSLSSKITGSSTTAKTTSTVSANKTTVQSKIGTTASSPKSTTAKPKPPTTLMSKSPTVPKSKVPTTRTSTTKGPDTEKQIKESVNKQLTATNRASATRTTGLTSTGKTTTTVKKTETKFPSTRTTTTTKTTVTTIKSTNKKPTEITRITAKKTTPTKTTTIKTQQNGLTNGVTKTIVQETTAILSTEPQLIKDLSPVENKLIIDNSILSETNIAD